MLLVGITVDGVVHVGMFDDVGYDGVVAVDIVDGVADVWIC